MRAERLQLVSVIDPAIDTARITSAEMDKYIASREHALISPAFKPGEFPTVYHIREVPHHLWDSYVMAGSPTEHAVRAFRCSLERVEQLYQRDGVRLETWKPASTSNGKATPLSDDECAMFAPSERMEIGEVALTHSFLPRRISACFRLPYSLAVVLDRATFRPAESSPADAGETSSAKPSASSGPSPAMTGSDSGQSGGG